jgi:hypothetical protein
MPRRVQRLRAVGLRSAFRRLSALARVGMLVLLGGGGVDSQCSASEVPREITRFLQDHCSGCHADGAREGNFDLDSLAEDLRDPASHAAWVRLFDQVAEGRMPPSDAEQPEDADRQATTASLRKTLTRAHAAEKGTVFRRLNRREYENTLNDLFGTHLQLASLLPEDGRAGEFDTVGEALEVSDVQVERYLEAIDRVLDDAIAKRIEPVESETRRASYADTRGAEKFLGNQWLQLDDGAVVFYRRIGYPSGMLREANVQHRGRHRIRVTGYAHQSDRPITFSVGATTFARGAEKPTFGYFSMPPKTEQGEPRTVELEAWIEDRYMMEVTPWGISDDNYHIKKHGIENYEGPGLAILHIEVEGPIVDEFPSHGHRLLFEGLRRQEVEPKNPAEKQRRSYVPQFEIVSESPVDDVRTVLQRVANRAFRRPAPQGEIERYVQLFQAERELGASIEEALRTAVAAIFCSPDFLYLREPPGRLDDHAVAARLSYFLTRTAPDAPLRQAADAGRLAGDPGELDAHVDRLLDDPRSDRFIKDFTDSWLNLREIEFTSPDRNLYPEFDAYLQDSMLRETRSFLRELFDQNRSVTSLVASDFAMLNERLAEHYEIEGVDGPEMQRVSLPADSVRGGILSQGSVLKVSANGTNTSPVVRGVWVTERILGITPSPPPPGVPGVEPDTRGTTTLREQLARHRDSDDCRSCHALIDPPGFALESFNPIGGWRDRYRTLGEGDRVSLVIDARKVRYKLGLPVDASGVTLDGMRFDGFDDFRQALQDDPDRLARTLTTKLLVFATGREMGFSDRQAIDEIVRQSADRGHGVRDLLRLVVRSDIFQSK